VSSRTKKTNKENKNMLNILLNKIGGGGNSEDNDGRPESEIEAEDDATGSR
jgi:hypothetical protein